MSSDYFDRYPVRVTSTWGDLGIDLEKMSMRHADRVPAAGVPEPSSQAGLDSPDQAEIPEVGAKVSVHVERDDAWRATVVVATGSDATGKFFRVRGEGGELSRPMYPSDLGTLWQ